MKILLLLVVLLSTITFSQHVEYGINTSLSVRTTTSKPHNFIQTGRETDYESVSSFNFGIETLFNLSELINFSASLGYTTKVVSTIFSGPADGLVNATLHFNYISILPAVVFNPFGEFYLRAGPVFDFLVDTKMEQQGDYVKDRDMIEMSKTLRYGLIAAAGYKFPLSAKISLTPEIAYDLGLSETDRLYGGKYSSLRAGLSLYFN